MFAPRDTKLHEPHCILLLHLNGHIKKINPQNMIIVKKSYRAKCTSSWKFQIKF